MTSKCQQTLSLIDRLYLAHSFSQCCVQSAKCLYFRFYFQNPSKTKQNTMIQLLIICLMLWFCHCTWLHNLLVDSRSHRRIFLSLRMKIHAFNGFFQYLTLMFTYKLQTRSQTEGGDLNGVPAFGYF